MIWLLKIVQKFFTLIASNTSPYEIAGGLVLGSLMGLAPFNFIYFAIIFFFLFILRVNISAGLFGFGVFSFIAYLIDSYAQSLGYYVLVDVKGLYELWTMLYNLPIVPLTNFNNTLMMGSIVISLITAIPLFVVTVMFIKFYRKNLHSRLQGTALFKTVNKFRFVTKIGKLLQGEQ